MVCCYVRHPPIKNFIRNHRHLLELSAKYFPIPQSKKILKIFLGSDGVETVLFTCTVTYKNHEHQCCQIYVEHACANGFISGCQYQRALMSRGNLQVKEGISGPQLAQLFTLHGVNEMDDLYRIRLSTVPNFRLMLDLILSLIRKIKCRWSSALYLV